MQVSISVYELSTLGIDFYVSTLRNIQIPQLWGFQKLRRSCTIPGCSPENQKWTKKLSLVIRKLMIINDPNHEKYQIDTAFYRQHRARWSHETHD